MYPSMALENRTQCYPKTAPPAWAESALSLSAEEQLRSLLNERGLEVEVHAWAARPDDRQVEANWHQTWKTCKVPHRQRAWQAHCERILQPSWDMRLLTDEANADLIARHFPSFADLFNAYSADAQFGRIKRIDAVRLFYIYLYGGVYADLDMLCLRSLERMPLRPGHVTLGFRKSFRPNVTGGNCTNGACFSNAAYTRPSLGPLSESVPNAFFAAPRRHPFIGFLINRLRLSANDRFNLKVSPIAATGPVFLERGIHAWLQLPAVRSAQITLLNIRRWPIVYNSRWSQRRHPCGNGVAWPDTKGDKKMSVQEQHGLFSKCAARSPEMVMTTFWTALWAWEAHRAKFSPRAPSLPPATRGDDHAATRAGDDHAAARGEDHAISAHGSAPPAEHEHRAAAGNPGLSARCRAVLEARAHAPSDGTMSAVTILLSRLALRLPFAFVHYNDGEFMAANFEGQRGQAAATPLGNQVFSSALRTAVHASMGTVYPHLYAGVPCALEFPRHANASKTLVAVPVERQLPAVVWQNGNYALLRALLPRLLRRRTSATGVGGRLHLVGSQYNDIRRFVNLTGLHPVSVLRAPAKSAFSHRQSIRKSGGQLGWAAGDVVLVCVGLLGRILVTDWMTLFPEVTFLELGSFFNPFFRAQFFKGVRVMTAYHKGRWAPPCSSAADTSARDLRVGGCLDEALAPPLPHEEVADPEEAMSVLTKLAGRSEWKSSCLQVAVDHGACT